MYGIYPKRVVNAVLDAMTEHEKMSLEVLDSEENTRAFALLILKMLTGGFGEVMQARQE